MVSPFSPLQCVRLAQRYIWRGALFLAIVVSADRIQAQASSLSPEESPQQLRSASATSEPGPPESRAAAKDGSPFFAEPLNSLTVSRLLLDVRNSRTKFKVERLMAILRDKRHEGWVRTAYPDPGTGRPLIGGGFSLDLSGAVHVQLDPRNPNAFIEPSSAQLWQAAGLDLAELSSILDQFYRRQVMWDQAGFRQRIRGHALPPDISEEEAVKLLRISALQAIHNSRAYCAGFDKMNAWQQMALSQLVFQMGVNLEEFVTFLGAVNGYADDSSTTQDQHAMKHIDWRAVQRSLVQSQWARRYSYRAIAVIAMFDPNYEKNPRRAERQVRIWIHPPASPHRRKTQGQFAGHSRRSASQRRTNQS